MATERKKGTVKWFKSDKGYGFIADEEGTEYFVHFLTIAKEGYKTLEEGEQVTFEAVQGQKGLEAKSVMSV